MHTCRNFDLKKVFLFNWRVSLRLFSSLALKQTRKINLAPHNRAIKNFAYNSRAQSLFQNLFCVHETSSVKQKSKILMNGSWSFILYLYLHIMELLIFIRKHVISRSLYITLVSRLDVQLCSNTCFINIWKHIPSTQFSDLQHDILTLQLQKNNILHSSTQYGTLNKNLAKRLSQGYFLVSLHGAKLCNGDVFIAVTVTAR